MLFPARAMKPSGLGWAPGVPVHWDVAKICLIARLESGHTPSRQHPEYWVPEECTIPWFSLADVWQIRNGVQEYLGDTSEKISARGMANSAARLLPAGTVVLSRTASVGFSGIMPRPMATTQDFANWVPGERVLPEFLLYVLRAMGDEFRRTMMGSTHQTIYMPDIRRLAMPVPPKDEQARIVAVLRERLPRLDELIRKKERLIELLQEKRRALITEAVTKGLDPSVPMKDSGIQWIGLVPAHWDVAPLRSRYTVQLGKMLDSAREDGDGGYPYLRNANIRWGVIDTTDIKTMHLTGSDRLRYRLEPGDLLVCEGGANINVVGKSAIWRGELEECYYQKALHRLRPCLDLECVRFLFYVLWAAWSRGVFIAGSNPNTVFHLTAEKFRAHRLPFPPPTEQSRIAFHLESAAERINLAITKTETSLLKLHQYRQALITAAVTGKLEVA